VTTPDVPDTMSAYAALMRILDIHYQAQSSRFPEGECAVCTHYDSSAQQVLGDRFPCATFATASAGIGLDAQTGGAS
jgi:hypothetical protein